MREDCLGRRERPAIVQEPASLRYTPEGRSAPFTAFCRPLLHPIVQPRPHVVQQEVRVRLEPAPGQWCVTVGAADGLEQIGAGRIDARGRRRGRVDGVKKLGCGLQWEGVHLRTPGVRRAALYFIARLQWVGDESIRFRGRGPVTGSVANVQTRERWPVGLTELCSSGEFEQPCNERDLPRDVALRQPSHLSLPDHVHRLDALNRAASLTRTSGNPGWPGRVVSRRGGLAPRCCSGTGRVGSGTGAPVRRSFSIRRSLWDTRGSRPH